MVFSIATLLFTACYGVISSGDSPANLKKLPPYQSRSSLRGVFHRGKRLIVGLSSKKNLIVIGALSIWPPILVAVTPLPCIVHDPKKIDQFNGILLVYLFGSYYSY